MKIQKSSTSSAVAATPPRKPVNASRFDPEEFARVVKVGLSRGLIRSSDPASSGPVKIDHVGLQAAALDKVISKWVDITPEMAARWLNNNFRNRPLRDDTVRAYARDMVNGDWIPTHQGIAFNDRDELIDGQHRLHAIVLAGVTVRMMVTYGMPSEIKGRKATTMDAVDRGATRTVADQLKIQHGFSNGSITASICAAIASLCFGERTRRLSVFQTLEVYQLFKPAIDHVITHRSKQVGLRTTGVLAGFAFALMPQDCIDSCLPHRMLFQVMTGDGIAKGSATELLRAFLTSDEAKLLTRSLDRGLAELVMQAIYLEIQGKRVSKLPILLDGANYFRALQKDRVEKTATLFRLPKSVK